MAGLFAGTSLVDVFALQFLGAFYQCGILKVRLLIDKDYICRL